MARQAFWKGYLKLSLVTCPVTMSPAISESEKIRFHTLNRATGHRVESRYVDAETGDMVDPDSQARAYQRGDGDFVVLEDAELEAVALESARTIDIEKFVPRDSIAWIYYDRPHYLAPGDKVGEEAFSVIRDAMAASKTVGIARLVLYRREHAVMLAPSGSGIIVWTLRYGEEVRSDAAYFDDIEARKPESALLKMFAKIVDARMRRWSAAMVKDPVEAGLHDIINAKKKNHRAPAKATQGEAEISGNVVNIVEALRRSLAAEKPR